MTLRIRSWDYVISPETPARLIMTVDEARALEATIQRVISFATPEYCCLTEVSIALPESLLKRAVDGEQ